uniref:F-box domain-containing protein n=1 Tax=Brassica campestris TaxID=3711 RepID=M4DGG2_BRACM
MASSSLQTMMKEGEHRKWADLPPELTSLILQHLDAVEIVEKAKKVCRSWRSVCKDPSMWRKIEMRSLDPWKHKYHEKICRHAVDRSQGGLVAIHLWNFCTNSLLSYIAHRIKVVRRPNEPIHDYPFDATVNLAEDGYPDDFSDGSIPEDDYRYHSLSETLDFELQYFYD